MSSWKNVSAPLVIPPEVRSWMEINHPAIRHNLKAIRQRIGAAPGILGVIKANAYGHGALEVARTLAPSVEGFAVANLEEARQLAQIELGKDILLLGPCLPGERRDVTAEGFIATVSSPDEARAFADATGPTPARLNIKIDTGMGRIGCRQEHAIDALREIATIANASVSMISTHLPMADEDAVYTKTQMETFSKLIPAFRQIAPAARIHALNSSGILSFPEYAHDVVRPGLILYGSAYPATFQSLLQPVMTWKTRIVLLRDVEAGRGISYGRIFVTQRKTRVATLPVGYADGFPRQVSGHGAEVLIHGKRCPVLGRVTMDQILADVSACPNAQIGDEAVLIGEQRHEQILAADLAEKAGTISWDIFTGIKNRVHRFHLS